MAAGQRRNDAPVRGAAGLYARLRILMPLLLMVIFRKIEPLDGAGLQLAKRHQGRRRVGEEMAAGDRIALDADDAPVDAAAHPVGGHAEVGGDFRYAEPVRYLRPACPLWRKLEAMLQADSLHGAREHGDAAR